MTRAEVFASVGEIAYTRLRNDIVFGQLRPATRLRLEKLGHDYAVSVATLREVLSRLTSEGFIHFEAQRGFEVAPISAQDLAETSQMRTLLETYGLGLSFRHGDLDWEAGLVAAHYKLAKLETRMIQGDVTAIPEWKCFDRAFHFALIAACKSPALLTCYERTFDRFLRYQMLLVMFRGAPAIDEHQALLDAALARDLPRASALLSHHIHACLDYTKTNKCFDADGMPHGL